MQVSVISRVAEVRPESSPVWDEVAGAAGGLFESPAWFRVIRDAFGIEPVATVLVDGDRPIAGFAAAKVDDLVGRRLVSFPFSDYCNPLGESQAWPRLVEPVLAEAVPVHLKVLRRRASGLFDDKRFRTVSRAAWHEVGLAGGTDHVWNSLASSARQNIRRAERAGVSVRITAELSAIQDYHDLHLNLRRRKYGMLGQPRTYFEAMHTHFAPDGLAVLQATVNDELVASVVLLRWRDTAYYKLNASLAAANSVRANDALMWHSIRHACEAWGCTSLDLGASDLDQPGLIRYKEKYASSRDDLVGFKKIEPIESARTARARALVGTTASRVARSQRVPDRYAERVSNSLYRYFC